MDRIFITGTDTEVGKTFISAALARSFQASYWKPIQAGVHPMTDTQWVQNATGLADNHFYKERYCLKKPCSPHLAARLEGISIDLTDFQIPITDRTLIVEGCGGVLVPLNDQGDTVCGLIRHLQLPALIVCRSTLGTINHTLMTIQTLKMANVSIMGVIMNGPKNLENKRAIEKYGKVTVLEEVEFQDDKQLPDLASIYSKAFS